MTPDPPPIEVLDRRGAASPSPGAVLADPSGRRARLLGRVGRLVGLLFVAWFACLVLAGLGLLPASGIPLGSSVSPSQPQHLSNIPAPRGASVDDMRPAQTQAAADRAAAGTAAGASSGAGGSGRTPHRQGTHKGKTTTASGNAKSAPVTPSVSPSATANPVAASTHSNAAAPGQTAKTTTAHGHSGAAPGTVNNPHATTTTTTTTTASPGKSGSAPGQTRTDTTGNGPPN